MALRPHEFFEGRVVGHPGEVVGDRTWMHKYVPVIAAAFVDRLPKQVQSLIPLSAKTCDLGKLQFRSPPEQCCRCIHRVEHREGPLYSRFVTESR